MWTEHRMKATVRTYTNQHQPHQADGAGALAVHPLSIRAKPAAAQSDGQHQALDELRLAARDLELAGAQLVLQSLQPEIGSAQRAGRS